MSIQGFFKRLTTGDAEEPTSGEPTMEASAIPAAPEAAATNASSASTGVVSGFFSAPSRLLDTVQSKKNDLMSDISDKWSNMKLSNNEAEGQKSHSVDEDDASSASEYGDNGDRPLYAEEAPEARRGSLGSVDSLPDEEAVNYRNFISSVVSRLFDESQMLGVVDRDTFARYCSHHTGRSWFAKEALNQRNKQKAVSEGILRRLTEYFSIVLKECKTTEDFSPARVLMQLCFTYYTDISDLEGKPAQLYLYQKLHDHPIWQSTSFWNAAFFETLQQERAKIPSWKSRSDAETNMQFEKEFQQDVAFALLSQFTWNMAALRLPKDGCYEFLRKQAAVAGLPRDRMRVLKSNVDRLIGE